MGQPRHSQIKSQLNKQKSQTSDSDFWMKEDFFKNIFASTTIAIETIDKNIQNFRSRRISVFENYRRRAFL